MEMAGSAQGCCAPISQILKTKRRSNPLVSADHSLAELRYSLEDVVESSPPHLVETSCSPLRFIGLQSH